MLKCLYNFLGRKFIWVQGIAQWQNTCEHVRGGQGFNPSLAQRKYYFFNKLFLEFTQTILILWKCEFFH